MPREQQVGLTFLLLAVDAAAGLVALAIGSWIFTFAFRLAIMLTGALLGWAFLVT